jgi:lipoprotein-releasing system ATP-binding protein
MVNAPDRPALELCAASGVGQEGEVVRELTASFSSGRFHVLRGSHGCGKDLLLRWLGLLQRPATGEVLVQGSATRALSEEARAELRTQRFGFVFAAPFLLSSFTVIENIAMPLFKVSQVSPEEARRRTETLLTFVGLAETAESPVEGLSLREQYQVAVARGLVNEPAFLLVENLDGALAGEQLQSFVELLHRAAERFGTTIIATASPALPLLWPQRVLDIAGGAIISDVDLLPETGS